MLKPIITHNRSLRGLWWHAWMSRLFMVTSNFEPNLACESTKSKQILIFSQFITFTKEIKVQWEIANEIIHYLKYSSFFWKVWISISFVLLLFSTFLYIFKLGYTFLQIKLYSFNNYIFKSFINFFICCCILIGFRICMPKELSCKPKILQFYNKLYSYNHNV
jgi:hypothetical protein